ncbi:hypothetical protein J7I98_04280 [Streptomyces sp. ISL-98]|uniref:hypothetical protein n=1 Tax=Streptomyces sp. ISL-98 TaxID=2819192 RepID=UPI001BEA2785|nr:hypothetical protein [Streptomyces sp. ISL-98]MBT2505125.1 hypothetical protein [Streptomyces sp. ISL-98]
MTTEPDTTITAVDGRDALAFVIVRPGSTEGSVSIEAAAKGLSKPAAAYVLRSVADGWDDENAPPSGDAEFPATWNGGHSLVVEYGDCELYGRCQCGKEFGMVTPDKSLDRFAGPWELHVRGLNS